LKRIITPIDEHTLPDCAAANNLVIDWDWDSLLPHGEGCRCVLQTVYPEHEKLKALNGLNQRIGEFIDWLLEEKKYRICGYSDKDKLYWPLFGSTESLLADYFNIDLHKLEEEKRAILNELRSQQSDASDPTEGSMPSSELPPLSDRPGTEPDL
jgi:hypothetical protein